MLLRIDDTDAARNVAGGEEQIVADLEWLGIVWNDGPVRQSDRRERHLQAAHALGEEDFGISMVEAMYSFSRIDRTWARITRARC